MFWIRMKVVPASWKNWITAFVFYLYKRFLCLFIVFHWLNVFQKKVETRNEVQDDQDIMDSIDASYFIDDDDFNAIDYELKVGFYCFFFLYYLLIQKPFFPESYLEDLGQERLRLKSQLQVVSKKISVLIMEKVR